MTCQQFEEWLALDVGGDLDADESAKLQAHLGECEACGRFAEELLASRASLRALHGAALHEDRLAAVRGAVLDEVRETAARPVPAWEGVSSPGWLRPSWALAGVAAACVLVALFWSPNVSGPVEQGPAIASLPSVKDTPSDVPLHPEAPAVEARPIETAAAQPTKPATPLDGPNVTPEVSHVAAVDPAEAEPTEGADDHGIEVVSMPDTESDDPDTNPDVVLRLATNNPNITIYWLVGQNGD